MDFCICSQCGANFPRYENVKKEGRLQAIDWTLEDKPTCPKCRGLKMPAIPKHDVLGGFGPRPKQRTRKKAAKK